MPWRLFATSIPKKMPRLRRYVTAGILLTAILVGLVIILRSNSPKLPAAADKSPRTKGPVQAPIQIIEYSDFECPACQKAQSHVAQLIANYPNKIRLNFYHFPLEGHKWSALAHRAAECASQQERFWPYHDKLYENQAVWSKSVGAPIENFLSYAKEAGVELDLFAVCLSDARTDQKILEDKATGLGLGVRSTPSFFVNGKLVLGASNLRAEIEKLAAGQPSNGN